MKLLLCTLCKQLQHLGVTWVGWQWCLYDSFHPCGAEEAEKRESSVTSTTPEIPSTPAYNVM